MYKTLAKAIDQGLPIRHDTRYRAKYFVKSGSSSDSNGPRLLDSTLIPGRESSDEDLLISTLFPGVTCDVEDREGNSRIGWEDRPEMAVPGHGLFFLVDAAVSVFGGSVAFRTGNLFMNVSAPSNQDRIQSESQNSTPGYKIKIIKRKTNFLGNMVTVRLPLDGRAQ